jgi:hypothetical protein
VDTNLEQGIAWGCASLDRDCTGPRQWQVVRDDLRRRIVDGEVARRSSGQREHAPLHAIGVGTLAAVTCGDDD